MQCFRMSRSNPHKLSALLLQMQKHADKLQQEKEEQCMSDIKSEMPNVSPAVLALALHEVDWDVRAAVQLVSLFVDARARELDELQQVLHSLPVHFFQRSSVARLTTPTWHAESCCVPEGHDTRRC